MSDQPPKHFSHLDQKIGAALGADPYKLRMVEVVTKDHPRDFTVSGARQFEGLPGTSEGTLNVMDKKRFEIAGLHFSLGTVYDQNHGDLLSQLTGAAPNAMKPEHYARLMGYLKEQARGEYDAIIRDGIAEVREINRAYGRLNHRGLTVEGVRHAKPSNPTHVISQAYQPGQFNEDLEGQALDQAFEGSTGIKRFGAGIELQREKLVHPDIAKRLDAKMHPVPADGKIEIEKPYLPPQPDSGLKKPGGKLGK